MLEAPPKLLDEEMYVIVSKGTGYIHKTHSDYTGVWFRKDLVQKACRALNRRHHRAVKPYQIMKVALVCLEIEEE